MALTVNTSRSLDTHLSLAIFFPLTFFPRTYTGGLYRAHARVPTGFIERVGVSGYAGMFFMVFQDQEKGIRTYGQGARSAGRSPNL